MDPARAQFSILSNEAMAYSGKLLTPSFLYSFVRNESMRFAMDAFLTMGGRGEDAGAGGRGGDAGAGTSDMHRLCGMECGVCV